MTKAHVLVVDDEIGIATLCDRVLTRIGYRVTAFTEPQEALTYLHENRVDLLLVDIRMPGMSGFDLIKDAYDHQPEIAVLVMTGFGTVETAIQALHQGVDGLILKPFEKDELVAAVERALSENQNKRDVLRMQALRPLFDVTEALMAETRPERLTERVLDAVCGHLHCAHAALYQSSDVTDKKLRRLGGRGRTLLESDVCSDESPLGDALSQNIPVWVNASGPGEIVLRDLLEGVGFGAIICVPTALQNLRTVIFAGRDATDQPFREVDLETLLILARQATAAMENARLYEELRAYVKRVEESRAALVQAEKLATAGRMTASIAHEINNPLQAVRNCLHLAGRKDLPEGKRGEYFGLAQSELERLADTVQRMLNFYRPNVARELVQIPELLEHALTLMRQQLDQRGIRVEVNSPSKLPSVMAVGSQLQQVFLNIFLNAFDAMPEGGDLKIDIRRSNDMVEITFRDTGHGIPPELRSAIFEPFTSTKEGGTGLGLSVSYGIIAAHGGNLDLLTDRGPGACFRILLPIGESV
jgi:two-component system NtrC family sensor kinase